MNGENNNNNVNGIKNNAGVSRPATRVVTYKRPGGVKRPASVGVPPRSVSGGSEASRPIANPEVEKAEPIAEETIYEAPVAEKKFVNNKIKKRRVKQGISPLKLAMIILVTIALIVGTVVLSLFFSGYRYSRSTFEDHVSATTYVITFLGRVDENEIPLTGTLTFSDNTKAKISRNESGVVKVEYPDGSVYEGEFKDMHRNGKGVYTLKNGDVYSGEFFYDRMWGTGEYRFFNGDVYKGTFKNNVKEGRGEYVFANGNRYVGSFSNNMRNGEGVFTYADGSVYEGCYLNDKKNDDNAKMTIVRENKETDIYVGAFVNDVRHGIGTYTFSNGDSYTGEFKANYISGHGVYTWESGRTYEGEFLNGAIVKDTTVYPG